MKSLITFLIVIVFSWPTVTHAQAQEYDKLLLKVSREDGPGAVALVVKDGKVLYRKAIGMANMEMNVKLTPDHVFRIGSITKQFTASAILRLAEQGKLNLQDDITKYIKDYPTHGYHITIEHLLTHTSGIKSYTGMSEFNAEVQRKDMTPATLIDFFKKEPMDFPPGTEYRYNNSGYVLLGQIIETVSGKKYADYLRENFFEPLKMKNTYYDSPYPIIPNRAQGYEREGEGFRNANYLSMTLPYAAGSLISTVDDLYTWYNALMNDKVISASSRQKAHTPYTLTDGHVVGYGYGWSVGNIQGSPSIGHGGGINGFLTNSVYVSNEKVFVALLTNCGCDDPGEIAAQMAAVAIGKPYAWKKITLPEKTLQEYQAVYTSSHGGDRIITFQDVKLYSMRAGGARFEIFPYEKDKFFFDEGPTALHFLRGPKNKISGVVLKSAGLDQTWTRTDQPIPEVKEIEYDVSLIEKYLGKYELAPTFVITVMAENNKVWVQATGQQKLATVPVDLHKFSLVGVDAQVLFNFEGDKVVSLTLFQNGEHIGKKIE